MAIICVLLFTSVFAIRQYLQYRLTPAQWATIDEAQTQVISLPGDWHKPAKIPSPEVVNFHRDLQAEMDAIRTRYEDYLFRTRDGVLDRMKFLPDPVGLDKETTYVQLLADLNPLIKQASEITQKPGYTLEIFPYSFEVVNFLDLYTFEKLMIIQSMVALINGNDLEAVDLAFLSLRLNQREEQSLIITHMIAVIEVHLAVTNLYRIAELTTNTAALRHELDLLNQLRPRVFPGEIKNWIYGSALLRLRTAAADGYPIDLSPQAKVYYIRQNQFLESSKYLRWLVEHLPLGSPRRPGIQKMLDEKLQQDQSNRESLPAEIKRRLKDMDFTSEKNYLYYPTKMLLGVDPFALLHINMETDKVDFFSRANTALARYDMTRMYIQRRLQDAGIAVDSSTTTNTADAYIDPYSGKPFQLSGPEHHPYSIGPDKEDDKAAITYDATNGTLSSGDIILHGN
jgi:hypothetical protein